MGWKDPSKQGTGNVLEESAWGAGGEDAAGERGGGEGGGGAHPSGDRKHQRGKCRCVNSPVLGDGARMALTPNLRNVGSLLCVAEVLGEQDSRVTAAGAQLKDAAETGGPVRLMKAAGRLIRSRSSTRKLDGFGKTEGRVWWSGSAAAGRYKPA